MDVTDHIGRLIWDSYQSNAYVRVQFYLIDEAQCVPIPGILIKSRPEYHLVYIHCFNRGSVPKKFRWAVKFDNFWYPADPFEAPLVWFPIWAAV